MRSKLDTARIWLGLIGLGIIAGTGTAMAQEARYGLNPGDVMQISVWREAELTRDLLVRPDGKLSFPLVGEIHVANRTPGEVRDELAERLAQYIPEPVVTVAVVGVNGNRVYVLGKVARPGEYVMNRSLDVMQALAVAGGLNAFAASNKIMILRRGADGRQQSIPFRYDVVESGNALESNIMLQAGDVVVVP